MKRDPLAERAARLFAAGREESPSEDARRRTLRALESRTALGSRPALGSQTAPKKAGFWAGRRASALPLAALSLGGLFLFFTFVSGTTQEAVDISAESATFRSPPPEALQEKDLGPRESGQELPPEKPSDLVLRPSKPQAIPEVPEKRAPPTLDEELATMNAARTSLGSGKATAALAELDRFEKLRGFRKLSVEASLLRIESLAKLGRLEEARARAVRFIAENPNNPLVDRAAQFARSSSPEDVEKSEVSESE
jgi:hypothetical protein